jgi:hypothetical protein
MKHGDMAKKGTMGKDDDMMKKNRTAWTNNLPASTPDSIAGVTGRAAPTVYPNPERRLFFVAALASWAVHSTPSPYRAA